MIDHLAELIEAFPGAQNRTRCFAHILNLVAWCILKQFDFTKANLNGLDDAAAALAELADGIDDKEHAEQEGSDDDGNDDEVGLIDICEGLSELEMEELNTSVQPVRLVLVKASDH